MTYDPASAWDEADSAPFAAPHVQRGDLVSVQLTDGTLITDTYFVIDKTEQSALQMGIAVTLGISPEAANVVAAVMSGDICDHCGAPRSQRHLDECPQHPEFATTAVATIDELRRELATVTEERDAALLRVSELEAKVIDLQEWVREPAEPWHGKAGQS